MNVGRFTSTCYWIERIEQKFSSTEIFDRKCILVCMFKKLFFNTLCSSLKYEEIF